MTQTEDKLWLAFESLAKTYPNDGGVRMTADLARWLLEEHERLKIPTPPVLQQVVRTMTQELDASRARPLMEAKVPNQ